MLDIGVPFRPTLSSQTTVRNLAAKLMQRNIGGNMFPTCRRRNKPLRTTIQPSAPPHGAECAHHALDRRVALKTRHGWSDHAHAHALPWAALPSCSVEVVGASTRGGWPSRCANELFRRLRSVELHRGAKLPEHMKAKGGAMVRCPRVCGAEQVDMSSQLEAFEPSETSGKRLFTLVAFLAFRGN